MAVVTQRLSQLDPTDLAAVSEVVIDPFAGYKPPCGSSSTTLDVPRIGPTSSG
jgi:hypothetical protein